MPRNNAFIYPDINALASGTKNRKHSRIRAIISYLAREGKGCSYSATSFFGHGFGVSFTLFQNPRRQDGRNKDYSK